MSALKPTLAGLVLFGKPLALRRLFPALRIDYVRVVGSQWVDDPEQRFQSVDIRKPLMLALPLAEASVVDELPKGFRLPEGVLQSRQEPVLSRKVLREALANAVMHRSYQDHSPIQIVRYSNRIEISNPGFFLKDMASLGAPGSRMRNPAIAAVLHEINWAETKGSGIRTMLATPDEVTDRHPEQGNLPLEGVNQTAQDGKQNSEGGKRDLPPLPPALVAKLPAPRQRMGETALRQLIRDLCGWQALRGEELAILLGKDLKYLHNKHLSAMVQSGELVFQYPESPNHALQAYIW